jgi:hypothetical protein
MAGQQLIRFGNSVDQVVASFARSIWTAIPLFHVAVTALAFSIAFLFEERAPGGSLKARGILIASICAVITLYVAFKLLAGLREGDLSEPLGLLGLFGAILVTCYGLFGRRGSTQDRPAIAVLLVFIALPFAIAFGSANPLFFQIASALFSFLTAILLACRLYAHRLITSAEVGLPAFVFLLLVGLSFSPYGKPRPMHEQTEPILLPVTSSVLRVDQPTKAYVEDLRRAARSSGFAPGTPVIDLSGTGPANAMVMGGRAPVFPWFVTVTEGAAPLVDAVWTAMTESERKAAWIIGPVAPALRRSRFAGMLAAQPSGYACVASAFMHHAAPAGGRITLWRPNSDSSLPPQGSSEACMRAKLVGANE